MNTFLSLKFIWMRRLLQALLILVPPVTIAILVYRFHVDVPFWDQWALVPDLERIMNGNYSLDMGFRFHNEHRLFFPRMIMVGVARLTRWDIGCELAVNYFTGILIFMAFFVYIRKIYHLSGRPVSLWPVCLGSWFVFSINQASNWFWGWQIQILLAVLCIFLALIILATRPVDWKSFILAAVFSVIASYSFGNALLIWPMGFLILLLRTEKQDYRSYGFPAFWMIISALVVFVYFHDGTGNGRPMVPGYILRYPIVYIKYVLAFIGGPVYRSRAIFFGIAGLLMFFTLTTLYCKRSGYPYHPLILPVSLCLFVIISALIVALGRVDMGWHQGASSRYTTIGNLFWYGLIGLWILNWKQMEETSSFPKIKKWLSATGLLLLILLTAWDVQNEESARSCLERKLYLPQIKERQQFLQEGRRALLITRDEAALNRLYPDLDVLYERDAILQKYRLGVHRPE